MTSFSTAMMSEVPVARVSKASPMALAFCSELRPLKIAVRAAPREVSDMAGTSLETSLLVCFAPSMPRMPPFSMIVS